MQDAIFTALAEVPCGTSHWCEEAIVVLAGVGALLACFAPYVWPDVAWCEDVRLMLVLVTSLLCYKAASAFLSNAKQAPKDPCATTSLVGIFHGSAFSVKRVWQRRRLLFHTLDELCDQSFRKAGMKPQYQDEPGVEDFHRYPKAILPIEVVAYRSSSVELGLWLPALMRPRDTEMASIPEDAMVA